MSVPRLASRIEVSALLRRVQGDGGTGVVLARGDAEAGAILVLLAERGEPKLLLERLLDARGRYRWTAIGTEANRVADGFAEYLGRRRQFDHDLWVVELDIAGVEQFAAAMTDDA